MSTSSDDLIALDRSCYAPLYARQPLAIARGEGTRVWDEEGRSYLDFMSGIAVQVLGHAHPAVVAAIAEQAARTCHVSNIFLSRPQVELASAITTATGWPRVFFCNSGTEAMEGAIKFARRFWYSKGSPWRHEITTFSPGFHGRTLGALSATPQESLKEGFGPMVPGFVHAPMGDIDALDVVLGAHTAAVILEPVLAEGGVLVPPQAWVERLRALQEQHGFLLVADEIQTGWGRCGELLAHPAMGLCADLVTLAKPIGGGLPLGAVLLSRRVAECLAPGDHGTTFGGNPVACAAGRVVLDHLLAPGFLETVRTRSLRLLAGLGDLCRSGGPFTEVRGRGLLCGVVSTVPPVQVMEACRARGVLVYKAGHDVVRLLPPLNVLDVEIDEVLAVLAQVSRA